MLEMAFDTVRMAREKYKIEEEGTDGLLLREIVEHSRDRFGGGITFGNCAGRIFPGVHNGPYG